MFCHTERWRKDGREASSCFLRLLYKGAWKHKLAPLYHRNHQHRRHHGRSFCCYWYSFCVFSPYCFSFCGIPRFVFKLTIPPCVVSICDVIYVSDTFYYVPSIYVLVCTMTLFQRHSESSCFGKCFLAFNHHSSAHCESSRHVTPSTPHLWVICTSHRYSSVITSERCDIRMSILNTNE
jgi:hypothetical protein